MIELSIDRYDLQLLAALQHDGHATNAGLGEAASLSASQVSRRIQRLEEAKVITGYAALLDHALGLGVTAYAQVILERHDKTRPAEFEKQIAAMPEVLECFAVTGEADYMLRIVAPDLAAFLRPDDETPAHPARRRTGENEHRAIEGEADARTAARSCGAAEAAEAAGEIHWGKHCRQRFPFIDNV